MHFIYIIFSGTMGTHVNRSCFPTNNDMYIPGQTGVDYMSAWYRYMTTPLLWRRFSPHIAICLHMCRCIGYEIPIYQWGNVVSDYPMIITDMFEPNHYISWMNRINHNVWWGARWYLPHNYWASFSWSTGHIHGGLPWTSPINWCI